MAVPPFGTDGNLPIGGHFGEHEGFTTFSGHDCSLDEMESALVTAFEDSMNRPILFREFQRLHAAAMEHLDCALFLVAGQFATSAAEPEDIFVVLDVPGDDLSKVDPKHQWVLQRLFGSAMWDVTSVPLTITTGLVRSYAPGHPKFELGLTERLLSRFLAGSPTEGVTKGYLEVMDCERGWTDVAEITTALAGGDQPAIED